MKPILIALLIIFFALTSTSYAGRSKPERPVPDNDKPGATEEAPPEAKPAERLKEKPAVPTEKPKKKFLGKKKKPAPKPTQSDSDSP